MPKQKNIRIFDAIGTWKEKRDRWVSIYDDCHSPRFARENLQAMDESVKDASLKYRETFKVAEDLLIDGVLDPMPKDLCPDWSGQHIWSLKIGAYHDGEAYGGATGESGEFRMSNVTDVERLCFESVGYFQTYIYKGMAHGSWNDATYSDGSFGMDRWLVNVKQNASRARRLAALEKKVGISWQPEQFWKTGEWLDQLTGPYIVKNHPGKTIFDLCPDPGWLDTHHAPAEEVEYIERKLKELGMEAGTHDVKQDSGSKSVREHCFVNEQKGICAKYAQIPFCVLAITQHHTLFHCNGKVTIQRKHYTTPGGFRFAT